MITVDLDPLILEKCPKLQLACLQCQVKVQLQHADLWKVIRKNVEAIQEKLGDTSAIASLPAIRSTRKAYKNCGKDPARYRPSAESLLRRVLQGKDLYQLNNVVDLLNLVSLQSGFSIGGYDTDQIDDTVHLGIGQSEEIYEGIGRGELNIEYLPVLRDRQGAFGSPTSDSVRTMVSEQTTSFLMVFFDFGAGLLLEDAMEKAIAYLHQYAAAHSLESKIISNHVG